MKKFAAALAITAVAFLVVANVVNGQWLLASLLTTATYGALKS